MHVDTPGPDRLILHTARNRSFMALGLALAGVGLLILVFLARVTTLSCARTGADAGLCRVSEASLFRAGTSALLPVRRLRGAHVERVSAGVDVAHLVLHVEDGFGPYPYTWHLRPAEAEAQAARINGFVGDLDAPAMAVTTDNRPLTWPVAGLFVALGALFLVHGGRSLTVFFDKGDRTATLRRAGLFGAWTATVPFDDIAAFDVAGVSKDCTMYLTRRSGRALPLSLSTDWEAMVGPRRITEIRRGTAARLAAFCELGA